jgi:hypothetical protein
MPKQDYSKSLVNHLSKISELSYKNKAYIFPRNGFLLGIIRHNGFLPNEGIDVDLACLADHIPKILNSDWGDYIVTPQKKFGNWDTDFTNGKHPVTDKKYEYYNLIIKHKYSDFNASIYVFQDLNHDNYFYPLYTIKEGNSKNEFKLNTEIYETGGCEIFYKNKILPLTKLYDNKEYLGKVGLIYKKKYFINLYPERFYDKKIYVPINSKDILKRDYGDDVFRTMINKNGEKKNIYLI